jgi:hypothetical protein
MLLIEHLVTKYRATFEQIKYVDVFEKLIAKHESHLEYIATDWTQLPQSRYVLRHARTREIEMNEY